MEAPAKRVPDISPLLSAIIVMNLACSRERDARLIYLQYMCQVWHLYNEQIGPVRDIHTGASRLGQYFNDLNSGRS